MGAATPESIINTLWFYSTIHFGTRTAEEHRNMCSADINLKVDGEGEEYLEFVERQTKTRTGDNPKDVRKVTPKMWSNPENISRCPVEVYKQYSLLRPSDFCKPEDPLYLATHTKLTQNKNAIHIFPRHFLTVAMIGIQCLYMQFVLYIFHTRSLFFKYLHYLRSYDNHCTKCTCTSGAPTTRLFDAKICF